MRLAAGLCYSLRQGLCLCAWYSLHANPGSKGDPSNDGKPHLPSGPAVIKAVCSKDASLPGVVVWELAVSDQPLLMQRHNWRCGMNRCCQQGGRYFVAVRLPRNPH